MTIFVPMDMRRHAGLEEPGYPLSAFVIKNELHTTKRKILLLHWVLT